MKAQVRIRMLLTNKKKRRGTIITSLRFGDGGMKALNLQILKSKP